VSSLVVPKSLPRLLHERRFARNGQYPAANFYARVANDLNHLNLYRKKEVFQLARPMGSFGAGAAGTVTRWRFRCHTGHATGQLHFKMGMALAETSGLDPYVEWDVTEAGGLTVTTPEIHYGFTALAKSDIPNEWSWPSVSVAVDPDTTYECALKVVDYARPFACSVWEVPINADDTIDHYTRKGYAATQPILDSDRGDILPATTALWKKNATSLLHWTRDTASITRSSATHVNILDGTSTAVSASTPGYTIDTSLHQTAGRATVPVVFAVHGSTSGGLAGKVRLRSASGDVVAIATISNVSQWHTVTALIPAASVKADLQFACDGVNTLTVNAVSLYEYEA
jgi:hypothetical protein